jgi:hypothetical protein
MAHTGWRSRTRRSAHESLGGAARSPPERPRDLLLLGHPYVGGTRGSPTAGARRYVALVREPNNPADRNAVQIWDPRQNAQVAWVPRELAKQLAPSLDRGTVFQTLVTGGDTDPERPRICVLVIARMPAIVGSVEG